MAIFIPLVTKFDDRGLKGAQAALANFNNFAVEVGRAAAAAVSAVAVAGVREAVTFESSFAKIQGLVGLTESEIKQLQSAARELGPQFGRSANEAADALFFITSSGLRGADATQVLEASLKGAAVGLGDITQIANVATAAVNTYGSDVLDGAVAVDALAEAVRLGQFAPEELAGSLGRVIPISAELGISIQETLGVVAGLTRGGLDAAEAVTGVRGAFQAFLKPSAEATRVLAQYGFSIDDVRSSIREKGFLSTIEELRGAFGDNDDAITKVFGSIEGLNAVLALSGSNLATNRDIIAQMTDGVGVLDDAMNIVSETTQFKFDQAMATAKETLLEIGIALLDRINPYIEQFADFMEQNGPAIAQVFDGIFEAVEQVAGLLGDFGEAIMPKVIELINNETFQTNMRKLGESFFMIAEEVIKFVDSDLGGFLLDITGASIIGGVGLLADNINRLANSLFVFNEMLSIVEGNAPSVSYETLMKRAGGAIGIRLAELATYFQQLQAFNMGYTPFAEGGIVPARPGGTLGLVGEAGEAEAIIPLSKLENYVSGGNGTKSVYNITVNAGMGANGSQIGEEIIRQIRKYERVSGPVFARA